MIPEEADAVIEKIQAIEDELSIPVMEQDELEAKDLLIWVGQEIDNAYLEQLQLITKLSEIDFKRNKDLSIVYTPLHGTGRDLVEQGLQQMNFKHVHIVEEQAVPDPAFSTVASPNPEEHQAFTLAIEAGEKQNADILLATDPDADRLGVAVKNRAGEYTILTGNQLGSLMVDYLLKHTEPILLQNARVLKSIVSTEFAKAIAEKYGVEVVNTLTGFKYIAEKIHHYDETGETFMFGFEESYGYLVQGFVRDKDAVQASIMACEMAYYWKQQGKTLLEALEELYEQHGYYMEGMSSLTLEGREGIEQISRIMETIRKQPLKKIAHLHVLEVEDYLTSIKRTIVDQSEEEIALPQENVLKFILEKDSWVCLRPSGTEPKIKCYYGVSSNSSKESEQSLLQLKQFMEKVMHDIIASDA
ncbi:phospho-sugar mutase [Paracerasibacillus soli]|uniref:phosphoglucomutase (alpha-D-glucose-1,6-bisphosphate-dependent) n=2 Tax=Paracerasibacillus soli TaxID=480284 RepID=A0ABU5CUP5_9BACI|nr:phospho-sugar mutase [Virgibacillus soli]MDY0409544.1 phospho-sugar mutase [Virgibacillus soli]